MNAPRLAQQGGLLMHFNPHKKNSVLLLTVLFHVMHEKLDSNSRSCAYDNLSENQQRYHNFDIIL